MIAALLEDCWDQGQSEHLAGATLAWHAFLGLFPEAAETIEEIAEFVNGGKPR